MTSSDAAGDVVLPAVVLAGGLGTRLGAITATTPKPLVKAAGRPVLDWILTWLARCGVRDVLLLAGYLGEQIAGYVTDGSRWGVRVACSVEPAPLGTGGALTQARKALPSAFMLVYGDSYLPIDYAAFSRRFVASGSDAMMVVYRDRDGVTHVAPNASVEGGRVTRYAKNVAADVAWIDAGAVALRRTVLDRLPPGASALETALYPMLADEGRLLAWETAQRFYDAGTPERLRELEGYLRG
jgi:NDP-sugar pyrophosphorylase family protein